MRAHGSEGRLYPTDLNAACGKWRLLSVSRGKELDFRKHNACKERVNRDAALYLISAQSRRIARELLADESLHDTQPIHACTRTLMQLHTPAACVSRVLALGPVQFSHNDTLTSHKHATSATTLDCHDAKAAQ